MTNEYMAENINVPYRALKGKRIFLFLLKRKNMKSASEAKIINIVGLNLLNQECILKFSQIENVKIN